MNIIIDDELTQAILQHGREALPNESCGVLIDSDGGLLFMPCRNDRPLSNHFALNPVDYANAARQGEIVAIVHTHTSASALPSQLDKLQCEKTGLPWIIVAVQSGDIKHIAPCGFSLPLVGRTFEWGAADCFTLLCDYYQEKLNIAVWYDQFYEWEFWKKGQDLYLELEKIGFRRLANDEPPREHDVFIIRLPNCQIPSHAAIYLGSNKIIHHLSGKPSGYDLYTDFYQRYTMRTLRHEALA